MNKEKYTIEDFVPLIVIFILILFFSISLTYYYDGGVSLWMRFFMAGFFVCFSLLKIIRISDFVEAYRMYDIIAKKSIIYAYIYPFIEFALGFMYLFGFIPLATAIITIVIMGISAIGVLQKLNNREVLMCACLGMVFQVPMTWVTFFEDVLMIVMAFLMIYGL